MGKIKINVLGLSYSQVQSGAYVLVLMEEEGRRRLPIVIGSTEAQSIAMQLEGILPMRPLTHDLCLLLLNAFDVKMLEVYIHKIEEGIFYSEIICDNGIKKERVDARTSDAVALAMRFKCPIYTNSEVMEKAGVILDAGEYEGKKSSDDETGDIYEKSIDELETMLKSAVENENYELASEIRDEINRRKSEK